MVLGQGAGHHDTPSSIRIIMYSQERLYMTKAKDDAISIPTLPRAAQHAAFPGQPVSGSARPSLGQLVALGTGRAV